MPRGVRLGSVAVALMLLALLPQAALAQEGIEVTMEAGIDGYVDAGSPGAVHIEVTSPSLLVGSLEVSVGQFRTTLALEVPAGGQKAFDVSFPAPGSTGTAFVRIYDQAGEQLLRASTPLSAPVDALVVGLLDLAGLERTLATVRTRPIGDLVESVAVRADQIDARLSAVPYLVAGSSTLAGLSGQQAEVLLDWVSDGGRLVTTAAGAAAIGSPSADLVVFGDFSVIPVGRGEVDVVDDLESASGELWSQILRDIPRPASAFSQFGQPDPGSTLIEAAVQGGSGAAVPQLPWLLLGLLGYVLAVGPINLIVLRRLDKTHLTWITVPVLSLLAVGLFWLGSPRSTTSASILHGTVVIYDASSPLAASGVAMVAGAEGSYTLGFPAGWSGFPIAGGFGGAQPVATSVSASGSELIYDLENLGAATSVAYWTPDEAPFDVAVTGSGDTLDATITNNSDWSFWTWGIANGTEASAGPNRLAAGAEGRVTLLRGFGGDPFQPPMIDAFFRNGGFIEGVNDPWSRLWPLATASAQISPDVYTAGPFVYGYTDDLPVTLTINGRQVIGTGPALIIMPVDLPAGMADTGRTSGRLLAVDGADFIEGGGFEQYIGGAEAVYLTYRVPTGVTEVDIEDTWQGGMNREYALYDWTTGEFVDFENASNLDLTGRRSPTGEVVLVIYPQDFGEVVPRAVQMVWTTP
ncbi:MAG: hypothetical protein OEO77_07445 [Acidimicrobiia bacterium]|nr:hypothetical protein [Acidimicrobiia bacterium]